MASVTEDQSAMEITPKPRVHPENERDEQWVLNIRRNLCPAEMIDADKL